MFDLEFGDDFFFGKGYDYCTLPAASETPTSLLQALVSMHPDDWDAYCREVVKVGPETEAALPMAIRHIRRINSCTSLSHPVEVHIGQGWTILVYNRE